MIDYPIGGVDWVAVQKTLQNWVVAATGLDPQKVIWQQQDSAPRPAAPAVVLKISNINETGRAWVDTEDNPLTFATLTVTAVDASANTLTVPAHGLLTGDGPVQLASSGSLPAPLLADTDYWVIVVDANTLRVAASYSDTGGGQGAGNPTTPIDLTGAGSGTITISATADTVRAGEELVAIARSLLNVTLEMHCHTGPGVGMDTATSILQRVRSRRMLPSQMDRLINPASGPRIGIISADRVRAVLGTKDAVLFEPRAYAEFRLSIPSEEGEAQTIIQSVEVTDLDDETTTISGV